MEMAHMWRMANDPFVQVETTKRLLFPTDDPPEANTPRLGTEELESELAETPRSILSTTSRHEVNIFFLLPFLSLIVFSPFLSLFVSLEVNMIEPRSSRLKDEMERRSSQINDMVMSSSTPRYVAH